MVGSRQRHDANLSKLADFRGYLQECTNALEQPGNAMTAADACTLRSFNALLEVLARTSRADCSEVEGRLQRELDDGRRPRSDD